MSAVTPSSAQFIDESRRRAELYRWFAGLLADRLDPVLLHAYRQGPGRTILDNLAADTLLAPGARRIEAALDGSRSDKDLAAALSKDFESLFIAGTASPRASAWLGVNSEAGTPEAPQLVHRADILDRLRALLRYSGMGLRPGLPSETDHVAVLLDALAQSAEQPLSFRHQGEGDISWNDAAVSSTPKLVESCQHQLAFIDGTLMPWLPKLRDACAAHDPDGFYAGVTMLLVAYLERDRAFLAQCLDVDE